MPYPSLDGAFLLGLFSKKPRTCAVPSTRTMSPIRVLIFPVSTMIGRVTGKRSLLFSWINSSQDLARTYFFHRMQTDSQLLGYCHRGMCCELFFNYTFFFVFIYSAEVLFLYFYGTFSRSPKVFNLEILPETLI